MFAYAFVGAIALYYYWLDRYEPLEGPEQEDPARLPPTDRQVDRASLAVKPAEFFLSKPQIQTDFSRGWQS